MIRASFKLLAAALSLTVFVVGTQSVQARGKLKTVYKYYTVSGSSAASLHRNMTVPTGFFSSERAYANITMNPSFSGTFKQGKRCQLKGFGINAKFTVRLPKLRAGTKLSRGLNRKFKHFAAYVRKHELTHRRIWTGCLRASERRINRLRIRNCNTLDQAAAKIITQEFNKCKIRNARFDAAEQKRLRKLPLVKAAFAPRPRKKPNSIKNRRSKTASNIQRRIGFGKASDFLIKAK